MTAQAQPAVTVLTVNLAEAYDGYYKTTEANNKLREAQEKAQEQIEALNQEGNVLVEVLPGNGRAVAELGPDRGSPPQGW